MSKMIFTIILSANILSNSFGQGSILGYGWMTYDPIGTFVQGPISLTIPDATFTQLSSATIPYLTGADFVGNQWYGAEYSSANSSIYTINTTTGATNLIGASGIKINSLAYDVTNDQLYATSFSESINSLWTINLNTGQATFVGEIGSDLSVGIVAGLAINNDGEVFGLEITNNNLLSIDKSTAISTVIGPLGLDLNYEQDITFDRDNNVLYGALYTFEGVIAEINTVTGAATTLETFPQEVTGLAIPYDYTANIVNSTIDQNLITIYPNPCSEELNIKIETQTVFQNFDIINENSQVVYSGELSKNMCIPTNYLKKGLYTIILEDGNVIEFIKQ